MRRAIQFTKMQASGNDFIIIERSAVAELNASRLAQELCDRAYGIGSDGLIIYECVGEQPIEVDFYNPDGTPDICGNGMRCLAGLVVTLDKRKAATTFELNAHGNFVEVMATLNPIKTQILLSAPQFSPELVPLSGLNELFDAPLQLAGHSFKISALNTGSTHCVIFVPNLANAAFEEIGSALECHRLFPQRTSVELVEVINRNTVIARVWERAIGETPACGTGAAAIAVVGNKLQVTDSEITVKFPGGALQVTITESGRPLLCGDVEIVFLGELPARAD